MSKFNNLTGMYTVLEVLQRKQDAVVSAKVATERTVANV